MCKIKCAPGSAEPAQISADQRRQIIVSLAGTADKTEDNNVRQNRSDTNSLKNNKPDTNRLDKNKAVKTA